LFIFLFLHVLGFFAKFMIIFIFDYQSHLFSSQFFVFLGVRFCFWFELADRM